MNDGYSFKKPLKEVPDKSNFKKGPSNIKTKEQCQKWCEKENDLFACSFYKGDNKKLDATRGSSTFFKDTKCVGMKSHDIYLDSSTQEPFSHEIEIDKNVSSGLCFKDYMEMHNKCKFVGGFGCTDNENKLVSKPSLVKNLLIEHDKSKYKKERKNMSSDLSNKKYGDMKLLDNLDAKTCARICQTHNSQNCVFRPIFV